jgi:predicted nucleotidyltransferase
MVDNIHPKQKDIFGFNVLDEPLIRRVFKESTGVAVILDGVELLIPSPVMLLATKLTSIQNRTKDDKLTKDACDIYAILWHSSISYKEILDEIHSQYPRECKAGFDAITDEVSKKAARHLGIDVETYRGVIRGLIDNL